MAGRAAGFTFHRAMGTKRLPVMAVVVVMVLALGCGRPKSRRTGAEAMPDWVRTARIAGAELDVEMTEAEMRGVLTARQAEKASVLELDIGLSHYLNDREFDNVVRLADRAARMAHSLGMRAVIYYPSLEVLTPEASRRPNSMAKDHPDWLQRGLDGKPNVFVGQSEHWVAPDTESAWVSPNSGYRGYFLARVRRLARTALDGLWVDVPVYLETGAAWSGAEPPARAAFRAWSKARGMGDGAGLDVPSEARPEDPAFRAWVRWRHENLADFLDEIRQIGQREKPGFITVVENFPVDDMDATSAGLDASYRRSAQGFIRVYEVDSVSNTKGMQWASLEDFSNKLAMFKWARSSEAENPSWVFSYGNEPLDAGLVMSAAVATGNAPFEAKTPQMLETVGSNFRQRWFGFIEHHTEALLLEPRLARVGVWYSSATRDYQDLPQGGAYGMFVTTTPPVPDPDWWATDEEDSAIFKPHLGGWRGAAHALIALGIPFRPVMDPGDPARALEGLSLLWLDSVAAMSDASAAAIKSFVERGGVVLATGSAPALLDDLGNVRPQSALAQIFGFKPGPAARAQAFGAGKAFYLPQARGNGLFAEAGDPDEAADIMSDVERILRLHVAEDLRLETPPGVFVEASVPRDDRQHLYVVNYTGLKQPLVKSPIDLPLKVRPPAGKRIVTAEVATPDDDGQRGPLAITEEAPGLFVMPVRVDQFALVTIRFEAESPMAPPAYPGPTFTKPAWREAAEGGLAFLRRAMRDSTLPDPWSFGVFTNMVDGPTLTATYAHGHAMTAEHLGLLLRAAACLKDETAFREGHRFVRELALSPTYHVVNWAMDPKTRRPLLEPSDDRPVWVHGNAPLDDLRIVRGLLAGADQTGTPEASGLARQILNGLYFTSVTDRDRDDTIDFPKYRGGLLGYAWDWSETDDGALSPPATATGEGALMVDPIPVDYQDLETIARAAKLDPRWRSVLDSATALVLDAEISVAGVPTGLFWNGLDPALGFVGDFENRDTAEGKHLKTIQVLWTALHLAELARQSDAPVEPERRTMALAAAERTLAFFRRFFDTSGRVPEYLTIAGADVPDCVGGNAAAEPDCLVRGEQNLFDGEARIYALLARLALAVGDADFAETLVDRKILTDRVSDLGDPRHGFIGVSTADDGDAEAWNTLESVLTICLAAGGR